MTLFSDNPKLEQMMRQKPTGRQVLEAPRHLPLIPLAISVVMAGGGAVWGFATRSL